MDPETVIDLGREAIWTALMISAPLLVVGVVVGLALGLLQAVTQVQEQTVAFVPKLVAMILALSLALPWLVNQMVHYTQQVISGIPDTLH